MKSERFAGPILLLLLTVLIPSVGVMWMMREAVRNERAATGQRLREAYQVQLKTAGQTIQRKWQTEIDQLSNSVDSDKPALAFANIVKAEFVDSVLVFGEQGLLYPAVADSSQVERQTDPNWRQAERMEFQQQDYEAAAKAYRQLADETDDSASARLALARCLVKAGKKDLAIKQLQRVAEDGQATDVQERSLSALARLRLLDLLAPSSNAWEDVAGKLRDQLHNYENAVMPASQRLFLMAQLDERDGSTGGINGFFGWPIPDAEALAASVLGATDRELSFQTGLQPTGVDDVWAAATSDRDAIALFRTDNINRWIKSECETLPVPEGVELTATVGDRTEKPAASSALMTHSLSGSLAPWQLSLVPTAGDPFAQSSRQRMAVHVWIAALTLAATFALAWMLLSSLQQRMKLAQLKNDLVATVSHELKTPLTSIRLLVDTLLDDDVGTEEATSTKTREYLQLISKENARLSRLIDRFLTFSSLERGRQQLQFEPNELTDLIQKSAAVFRDHNGEADSCLKIQVDQSATLSCDTDAMVTAIVNLLENAWKYSDDEKQIDLRASLDGDHAVISVSDKGIGLNAREAGKVFDRFYQVDQNVSRTREGCGLGLSIVRAIVQAHDGSVDIKSKPNAGSTFTIRLSRVTS